MDGQPPEWKRLALASCKLAGSMVLDRGGRVPQDSPGSPASTTLPEVPEIYVKHSSYAPTIDTVLVPIRSR